MLGRDYRLTNRLVGSGADMIYATEERYHSMYEAAEGSHALNFRRELNGTDGSIVRAGASRVDPRRAEPSRTANAQTETDARRKEMLARVYGDDMVHPSLPVSTVRPETLSTSHTDVLNLDPQTAEVREYFSGPVGEGARLGTANLEFSQTIRTAAGDRGFAPNYRYNRDYNAEMRVDQIPTGYITTAVPAYDYLARLPALPYNAPDSINHIKVSTPCYYLYGRPDGNGLDLSAGPVIPESIRRTTPRVRWSLTEQDALMRTEKPSEGDVLTPEVIADRDITMYHGANVKIPVAKTVDERRHAAEEERAIAAKYA